MSKQQVRNIVIVTFAVFTLLVSTFVGIKFIHTSVQLEVLASKIRSTEQIASNSPSGWSDDALSYYNSLQENRKEFTESSNALVRWFSNLNKGVKIIMFILTSFVWTTSLHIIGSYISYKRKCRKLYKTKTK